MIICNNRFCLEYEKKILGHITVILLLYYLHRLSLKNFHLVSFYYHNNNNEYVYTLLNFPKSFSVLFLFFVFSFNQYFPPLYCKPSLNRKCKTHTCKRERVSRCVNAALRIHDAGYRSVLGYCLFFTYTNVHTIVVCLCVPTRISVKVSSSDVQTVIRYN